MKTIFDQFKRFFALFIVLGMIYLLVEVTFTAITGASLKYFPHIRFLSFVGHTSLWMLPTGGLLGILLGLLNENDWSNSHVNLFWQSIMGMCIIFIIEFLTGYLFNIIFKLNIWDYSKMWFNIKGQITLCFAPLWFLICPLAFWVDDQLRYLIFKEGVQVHLRYYYMGLFKVTMKTNPKKGE